MKNVMILILIAGMVTCVSFGSLRDYAPFPSDKMPELYSIETCDFPLDISALLDDQTLPAKIECTNSTHKLVIEQMEAGSEIEVRITETQSGNSAYSGMVPGNLRRPFAVYSALLNEDDVPDWILETYSGGCGLAAGIAMQQFLLSTNGGFCSVGVVSWYPSECDFLDMDHDGRPKYVHTQFIYGEKGKDGKIHNYWVYNLLQFSGTRIVSANDESSEFPRWILYSLKPNHDRTNQLSRRQREKLWADQAADAFPNAIRLRHDQ